MEEAAADSESMSSDEAPPPQGSKPTLFIVDDSATVRAHLSMVLANEGRCFSFTNAEEAFRTANAAPVAPALFISDVLMEPLDGYELCRRVRANPKLSASSFLLLTAAEHTDWWTVGLRVGADDFMVKPFRPAEIVARVHSLVTLYNVRTKLKEQMQLREKAETELSAAHGNLELLKEKLARMHQELEAVQKAADEQGRGTDLVLRVDAQLANALSSPLNNVTQSIQQLMDAIHELEKTDSDERTRRKAVRAARTGYAQGLNEVDRIRILLQDDIKDPSSADVD